MSATRPFFPRFAERLTEGLPGLDGEPSFRSLFLVLTPLLILILLPSAWTGNEEVYFQSAYRAVEPEAFGVLHAVPEPLDARFLFNYLLGGAIALAGFDGTHAVTRLVLAMLYGAAFSVFFRALRVPLLGAAAVIAAAYLIDNDLAGHEWLLQGVESKSFAYPCVIAALGLGLGFGGRWMAASALMVLATYFHFLVGGFWMGVLCLTALLERERRAPLARMIGAYVALCLPLAALIVIEQISQPGVAPGIDVNRIFAEGIPFHVAPFLDVQQMKAWAPRALVILAMLVFFGLAARDRQRNVLYPLTICLLGYIVLAFVLSYLDRHTCYLAKFLMFRPTALTAVIAMTALAMRARTLGEPERRRLATPLCAALVVAALLDAGVSRGYELASDSYAALPGEADLVRTIERESAPGGVVLIEPYREDVQPYVGLPRRIPRPTWVSRKFLPLKRQQLVRWHARNRVREALFVDGCTRPFDDPIRLLLIVRRETLKNVAGCGRVVWSEGEAALIRVDDRWLPRR